MNDKKRGWLIFLAALGVMLGLLSSDLAKLQEWEMAYHPQFVASVFVHMSAVIAAFVGGKLIPTGE